MPNSRWAISPLNITGEEHHPDLSGFETTLKGRVRCKTCKKSGPPEEVWVFACLAGHPAVCTVTGCERAFTDTRKLAMHMSNTHKQVADHREDETKLQRATRLKRQRHQRLRDANINPRKKAA